MHARPKRIAALLALAIALLVSVSGAASAAVTPHAAEGGTECALPQGTDDDVISVLGRICDRRESPQAPVEGADVTVEDEAGEVIGEATSGADGTFVIDLPGTVVDHLGKTYVVKIDEDSLPEDTSPTSCNARLRSTSTPTSPSRSPSAGPRPAPGSPPRHSS